MLAHSEFETTTDEYQNEHATKGAVGVPIGTSGAADLPRHIGTAMTSNVGVGAIGGSDDRRTVAVAHSRNTSSDLATAIGSGAAHRVVEVAVRKTVVDELIVHMPDVVVVDASMADFDVERLCRDIRRSVGSRVLVVAADERFADEGWSVGVIESGADDVVPRSISAALLRAHLLALMRLAPDRDRSTNVVVGDVVVDDDGYSVYVGGRLVRFPRVQFRLLVALASRPNQAVSFGQLLGEVWGIESPSTHPRRVRVAVSLLRRLLGEGAQRPRLETVARVGYRLVVPS